MEERGHVCYRGRPLQSWCEDCLQLQPERRREERRRSRHFCWSENRSGFDNREHPAMTTWLHRAALSMRDDPGLLIKILLFFNIFNVADYVLTIRALAAGNREINPIMRSLFAADPLLAGVFKIAIGLMITLFIWRFRRYRIILQFSLLSFCLYLALIAYHLYGYYCG
ncbi:MAG: DUF5658 family protein [Deltaproteobacteria bacterium]|jgi:hypothetical protein